MDERELVITVLVSFAFMIGIGQLLTAIRFHYWITEYLSLNAMLNGFLSSIIGIFIAFRSILRTPYEGFLQKGLLFGITVPILYIIYVIVVGAYHAPIPNVWIFSWAFPEFVSSLIGCLIGFLLGGFWLRDMPAPMLRLPATGSTRTRKWRMRLVILAVATIILIPSLVVYATNIKCETWWISKEYEEGTSFLVQVTPSRFTVNIKLAIGNPSVFTVSVRDISFGLTVNGVDLGSLGFQKESYNIPAFGWRVFTGTFSATGEDAEYLGTVDIYYVYVLLRGKANCWFYSTLFETTHTMDNIRM